MPSRGAIKYYFVDEAGDLNLLDKRGRVMVGKHGCSYCFMVGLVDLPDPQFAHKELEGLRQELLADPRLRDAPFMQPEAKKTALFFHAKNDLPEVRREVFKLLPSFDAKVIVAIRRKILPAIRYKDIGLGRRQRLKSSITYDDMVSRIFHGKLHSADENHIVFARFEKSNREPALEAALARAQRKFDDKFGKRPKRPTTVTSAYPHESAGLQVADYYLWALQRMYEREDEKAFEMVAPQYRLVMDLDDQRNKGYGEWYSDANKLSLAKIKPAVS